MRKERIYLDTSVINFLFADDSPEFRDRTIEFFDEWVKPGKYEVFISKVVVDELSDTKDPEERKKLLNVIDKYPIKMITASEKTIEDIEFLASEYIKREIIPEKKLADALHVAYSVVHEMDYLLSWNFKHLANIHKEKTITLINNEYGFNYPFKMRNPLEVLGDE